MTTHREIIERIRELGPIVSESRRQALNAANHLAAAGDLTGAAAAIDAVEQTLHPALAAGGGGGGGEVPALPGVRVHWFKSGNWTVAASDRWDNGTGFGFATVDEDTDGFWDPDQEAIIVPAGLGGRYSVQMFVSYSSAVATGFVNANPFGTNEASYGPCVFTDDTNFQGLTHVQVVDFDDGANDVDEPSVVNLTDHDIKIGRVEVALVRLGSKP